MAPGFGHRDPLEQRAVVLDEEILPFAASKVNMSPGGRPCEIFSLKRLECTFAEASIGLFWGADNCERLWQHANSTRLAFLTLYPGLQAK